MKRPWLLMGAKMHGRYGEVTMVSNKRPDLFKKRLRKYFFINFFSIIFLVNFKYFFKRKLLNHPKASQLLGAMFSGMNGGGGMDFAGGEEENMDFSESKPTAASEPPKPTPKPAETKPDPKAHLNEQQRKAEEEKELGNQAYKKKDFEAALSHYEKASEFDPTNITYLTNKAAVYFEQNALDKCIETCEKAIEVGRENKADFTLISKYSNF